MSKFPVIAMKFGGTSVVSAERRERIVQHVQRERAAGRQVALVISAMGRRGDSYATDTLLDLLRNQGGALDPHTYSFIFVTGEMISTAVMTHTLQRAGFPAVALTGGAAGIVTEDFPMSARVVHLDGERLKRELASGVIPVVGGGQGICEGSGDFSVLGRGGSDTSGVLVGIMIGAERADIYTDVEYMLAADPRQAPGAPKRAELSYEAAYEMARFGAKVIHPGAVRLGMEHHLPVRVRSTFSEEPGTLIADVVDPWPLVGLPLLPSVQVAKLPSGRVTAARRASLEQHMGVVSLAADADQVLLCAPAGDTAVVVDSELAEDGLVDVRWQDGLALLSLIGAADMMPEMAEQAERRLAADNIVVQAAELSGRRTTWVVSEAQAKAALSSVYQCLLPYLEPRQISA
jgi:aspartate kinase